jgi:uncharacterized protein YndB with AHSA1/START domain
MTALLIRKSIEVDAPARTLWKVLTENEFIRQYMFGCNAESDWRAGSPLLWKGAVDGVLYVKGHVVSIEPPQRLVYTVIDPNSTIPDIPENYLTVTYHVQPRGDHACTLEITQGDFATVADGQKRYEDSLGGGDSIMAATKKMAETSARH